MKTSAAAVLAALALAPAPALGADLFGTAKPVTYPQSRPLNEVGSNWYLRGDIGLDFDKAPTFSMDEISMPNASGFLPYSTAVGSSNWRSDVSADLGGGYRFNDWLRFEGTWEYRTGSGGTNVNSVLCPTTLTPVPIGGSSYQGYLYDQSGAATTVCTGGVDIKRRDWTTLAAAYVDLGNYWGFTPYIGGGLGLNADIISGNAGYVRTDTGAPYVYNPIQTPGVPNTWIDSSGKSVQPNVGFTSANWNRSFKQTHYSMAWALMAGFGFQLTPSATLDIGYRYLNAGSSTLLVTPQTGAKVKLPIESQEFRIGIRYMAD